MTEFKGTPGQWEREGLTIYALGERSQVNRFSCHVEGGYQVKTPFQARLTSRDELAANACLIAAAPSLLEALQRIIDEPENQIHRGNEFAARVAIAKALGQ